MKKCLLKNDSKLSSTNKELVFDYDCYMNACLEIANSIKEKYNLEEEKIGLLGIARGGLPMLATLSHLLGVRDVSTIQLQMSNSDNCHDYGKVRIISENLIDKYDKFIVLEDIIYKGLSSSKVVDILKEKNKEVIDIYSLIIDEGFLKIEFPYSDIDINYAYTITEDDWVYFFWESDVRK